MNENTLNSLLRIALEGAGVDQFSVAQTVEFRASKKINKYFRECVCQSMHVSCHFIPFFPENINFCMATNNDHKQLKVHTQDIFC